eukprot:EG_transcript_17210
MIPSLPTPPFPPHPTSLPLCSIPLQQDSVFQHAFRRPLPSVPLEPTATTTNSTDAATTATITHSPVLPVGFVRSDHREPLYHFLSLTFNGLWCLIAHSSPAVRAVEGCPIPAMRCLPAPSPPSRNARRTADLFPLTSDSDGVVRSSVEAAASRMQGRGGASPALALPSPP